MKKLCKCGHDSFNHSDFSLYANLECYICLGCYQYEPVEDNTPAPKRIEWKAQVFGTVPDAMMSKLYDLGVTAGQSQRNHKDYDAGYEAGKKYGLAKAQKDEVDRAVLLILRSAATRLEAGLPLVSDYYEDDED